MGKASRRKKGSIDTPAGRGRYEKESCSSRILSDGSPHRTTSIITIIPILIILLVAFVVYCNALFGDFVFDDQHQVVTNPWIRDVRNIPTIFSKSVWSFRESNSNYYRPLMHIVYMVNYHLFGLKPWGFHLVNILFHCGVSVFVFLTARRLLTAQSRTTSSLYLSPPFIAAMLFAMHPIHTEAVTWIAGLPDISFTFFYLLSFYLYLSFRDGVKRNYPLSVFSFAAALLFKEPAITLPIILIAYDYLVRKPDKTIYPGIKDYVPYVVVSGVYLLARYHALRNFAPFQSYHYLSTQQLIINVFPLFGEYLASLLWPFNLNFWHTFHPIRSLFEPKGMISMAVAAAFIITSLAAYRKNKVFFFSLLLIVVPLLPAFYIKGISGKPFAERYLYLPSLGFVLLLTIFLSGMRKRLIGAGSAMTLIFLVVIGGLYSMGTVNRNNVWKDGFHLWSDTVKKAPDSMYVHYNLGDVYQSQGLLDKAIEQYRTALDLNPDYYVVHYNLGNAYQSQGLLDKAIEQYQTALNLKPDSAEVHTNLGTAYQSQGLLDKAIEQYQTALNLKPGVAEAHSNLGDAYLSKGLLDKAIEQYQAALNLRPNDAEVHNNLGNAYRSQGLLDKAIEQYQIALSLNPNSAEVHNNLGAAYRAEGQLDKAIEQYRTALSLNPNFAEAHFNLGLIYLKNRSLDMARTEFESVLRIRPDYDKARQALNYIIQSKQ